MSHHESSPAEISSYFVIIGAMKSGTTTLFDTLKQHPQICCGRRKEPHFFGDDSRWKLGKKSYDRLWPTFDQDKHKFVMEASTSYTKNRTDTVARRMRFDNCQFKLAYILRDPIDRIESNIGFNLAKDMSAHANLEPSKKMVTSMYCRQLDSFCSYHDKKDILLLDFDDLVLSHLQVAEKCANFLGLSSFKFKSTANRNKTDKLRGAVKYRLTEEQRTILRADLASDMNKLKNKYGFDVSKWGFN